MPAQTNTRKTAYYNRGDTAPPLRQRLEEDDGTPIDLTDAASVVINIAWASFSHYYAPYGRIVDAGACVIDPDQVTNTGYVTWTPQAGDLEPSGAFHYSYVITWNSGGIETIPPHTYLPMVIREPAGGA